MRNAQMIALAVSTVTLALVGQVQAVSGTWTGGDVAGGTPTLFTDPLNWSTGSVPGNGDTGTFSAANNGTTITLPAAGIGAINGTGGVTVSAPNIAFDATAVSYTLGTAANNSSFYVGSNGYNMTATLGAASQTINATIVLGNRGSAGASLSNNSTGTTDTYNGNITSLSNGTNTFWTLSLSGSPTTQGAKVLNGVISDSGIAGDGLLLVIGRGLTTVNGVNTYIGGTQVQGTPASLVVGNKSALGTGSVTFTASGGTIAAGADLGGANALANNFVTAAANSTLNFGGTNNLQINGTFDLNSTATAGTTTLAVANSATTTLAGAIVQSGAGATALTKTGTGVLVISNAANTYSGQTSVNGGTLLINGNTGTSAFIPVSGTGSVLGGSGTTAGLIQIGTGASLRPGPAVGNSTGVLTTSSTGNSALILQSGSTSVFDINGTARGTDYDGVTAAGKITYGGDLTINLNTITAGTNVYDLFNFATQGGVAFNTITLTGTDAGALTPTGGGNFSFTYATGDVVSFAQATGDLTVTSNTPEPAALGVLAGGAALLGGRRRRSM